MSNAFDTMVFLLCFSEITILTTAGGHDMILLDTNGLQKFNISHMFFLFSLGTNRLAFWAASGITSISTYFIDHIVSILGRLWEGLFLVFFFCVLAGKKRKAVAFWAVPESFEPQFRAVFLDLSKPHYLRHDSTHTVLHIWSGYISLGDNHTPPAWERRLACSFLAGSMI